MRLRQYVHFTLTSSRISTAEITERLMLEPDSVTPVGAAPGLSTWTAYCHTPGLSLAGQLTEIVGRLNPRLDALTALTADLAAIDPLHGGAALDVVAYLDLEPEPTEPVDDPEPQWPLGPLDQDPLRAWALQRGVLGFLLAVTPTLDVAVYG